LEEISRVSAFIYREPAIKKERKRQLRRNLERKEEK